MHRFFLPPEDFQTDPVEIRGTIARQMARVLRLKAGEQCVLLDNIGGEYLARLALVESEICSAEILEKRVAEEPEVRVLMMLCLTQREKFEWMLQKCTEVGVAGILPVISQRTLVQDETDVHNKYARWEGILREAAEQSGRGRIPELNPVARMENAVKGLGEEYQLRLIPWEGEKQKGLKSVLEGETRKKAAVLIGPEGGFADEEVQRAIHSGFQTVTLGRRILRAETAAVVSAALVLHELE